MERKELIKKITEIIKVNGGGNISLSLACGYYNVVGLNKNGVAQAFYNNVTAWDCCAWEELDMISTKSLEKIYEDLKDF